VTHEAARTTVTDMTQHVRLSPEEAKEKVSALRRIVLDTYDRTIKDQPFFTELRAGTLSRARLKGWITNWYSFAVEVNTGMATAYHQFVGFFKSWCQAFVVCF